MPVYVAGNETLPIQQLATNRQVTANDGKAEYVIPHFPQ